MHKSATLQNAFKKLRRRVIIVVASLKRRGIILRVWLKSNALRRFFNPHLVITKRERKRMPAQQYLTLIYCLGDTVTMNDTAMTTEESLAQRLCRLHW